MGKKTIISSIWFNKNKWFKSDARMWLKKHNFKAIDGTYEQPEEKPKWFIFKIHRRKRIPGISYRTAYFGDKSKGIMAHIMIIPN